MTTTTWRINHPTLTMRIAKRITDLLFEAAPPPYAWLDADHMEGAFAALDEHGQVTHIGYKGEWYTLAKPSLRTRIHNRFVAIYNHQLDGYSDKNPAAPPPPGKPGKVAHICEYADSSRCAWPGHRR